MITKAIKHIFAAALLFAFVLGVPAQINAQKKNGNGAAASPSFGNVNSITARQLRDYLTFIASDELEGRDTPSRGLDIAAMYIAQNLSSWGIKPGGGNGTYFQKFPLNKGRIIPSETRVAFGGQTFNYGSDFLSSLVPAEISSAPVVFAGYGWVIKSKNLDPYKGIDVKNKVVVVVNTFPKGVSNGDLKGPVGGDWMPPAYYAQANGAKAVVVVPFFNTLSNWNATRWSQSERGYVEYPAKSAPASVPVITASPQMLAALFAGEKFSGANIFDRAAAKDELEAFDLRPEKRIDVSVGVERSTVYTQNVVGILEGSDPVLKNEYVAVGAHYDHVGMNPFAPGPDKIWNGADDDGSGTVAVMSIAKALAEGAQKPKRSILFIWHAGEEKGLWGSEYFADNPTVPINSIVTQLNIDMIGRYQNPGDENHPQNKNLPKQGEVFTIGASMMSTELGQIADTVNRSFLNLGFNTKYDGPDHPEQFFYRSDHFNYAKKGIPIIFFMDGSHQEYHQPGDHVDKINFDSMEKTTKTIFAIGWELANRANRPKVDKPLPSSVIGN